MSRLSKKKTADSAETLGNCNLQRELNKNEKQKHLIEAAVYALQIADV